MSENERNWQRTSWGRLLIFVVSVLLFIFAIMMMGRGAESLGPMLSEWIGVDTPVNALGLGWLSAYLVLSGSPIAAAALTLFEAETLNAVNTLLMITGSRLGASFIVLFIGLVYILRGQNLSDSTEMGLLSLLVTGTTTPIAAVLGVIILNRGLLGGLQLGVKGQATSIFEVLFQPTIDWLASWLPTWSLFLFGVALLVGCFNLFDELVPDAKVLDGTDEETSEGLLEFLRRPWIMFMLGSVITAITMSVSVSLGMLVPLNRQEYISRETVIPYILGANITTFIDTLPASILIDRPMAFNIVLALVIAIAVVNILILLLGYDTYRVGLLNLLDWITAKWLHLGAFVIVIVVVPLGLLLL